MKHIPASQIATYLAPVLLLQLKRRGLTPLISSTPNGSGSTFVKNEVRTFVAQAVREAADMGYVSPYVLHDIIVDWTIDAMQSIDSPIYGGL
jgi:hypothetical protein